VSFFFTFRIPLEDILHKPICLTLVFFAACNDAPNV